MQILVTAPFITIFLLLMGAFIAAALLNFKEYRRMKAGPPIPVDLDTPLTDGTGLPWSPKFRGQRWPDPTAEPASLTIESAKRYAGAAERRARRCLLLGDVAIFILAIPSGLFAPMFIQRWPDPPPTAGWLTVSMVLASMIGGISLKVYAAPYWEAVRDAYIEAVDRLAAERLNAQRRIARRRNFSDRAQAAWQAFFN